MIVFDIEWNNGCDDTPLDEILQIGAVRLDRLGGKITGVFNVYIRPAVHEKLGITAREVLDMQAFAQAQWDFPTAYTSFREWCGDEQVFATWGNCDMEVLRRNCVYWKLPEPEMEEVYDIQDSFSAMLGAKQRIALYRAVEYCGIPDCFDCHNALNDAVYTAMIGEWLPEDGILLYALPKRIQRLSKLKFPMQPRRKIGSYLSPEAALNARNSREMICPICGKKVWVNTWHYETAWQYYTDFNCPEHGWFVCRLTLVPAEDGTWRGKRVIPALTPKLKRDFYAATKGNFFVCKTRGKASKRRRSTNAKRKKKTI